ncbi:unnamed protein product [Heterobilharzia americana]|nr:unnamed protein product [Heterobilharzia americana]
MNYALHVIIHHCRSCGQGVCGLCSQHCQPVPKRGLDFPTRVCDRCYQPYIKNSEISNLTAVVNEHQSSNVSNNIKSQESQLQKSNVQTIQFKRHTLNTSQKRNSQI